MKLISIGERFSTRNHLVEIEHGAIIGTIVYFVRHRHGLPQFQLNDCATTLRSNRIELIFQFKVHFSECVRVEYCSANEYFALSRSYIP